MLTKLNALRFAAKISKRFSRSNKQVYIGSRISQYENIWTNISNKLGASIRKLDRDLWEISLNNISLRVRLHEFPLDNNITLKICGRKPLVHKLISEQGIPVPRYVTFTLESIQDAYNFQDSINSFCVIKPCDGYSGLGVTTHITKDSQLEKAAVLASLYHDDLMAEEQIAGENYRILVYKGKVLQAVRRTGQTVEGDGSSTIAQLIQYSHDAQDKDLLFTLSAQNISLDHIPGSGQKVLVRSVGKCFNGGSELRTIYDTVVTDIVHKSIKHDVIVCAQTVGASISGVDIITTDITKDLRETGGIINEVNTTPALHHHYDESKELYPPAALYILKDLLLNHPEAKQAQ